MTMPIQPHANKHERGFSLLELVLALAASAIVIAFAVIFARNSLQRVGAIAEAREKNDRAAAFGDRLRPDIEAAGVNMVRISNESAGTEQVTISAQTNYQQAGAVISTLAARGYTVPVALGSRVIREGPGGIAFTVTDPCRTQFLVTLRGSDGWRGIANECGETYTQETISTSGVWNTGAFTETDATAATYEISIESKPDATYTVRYYRTDAGGPRRLLYTSPYPLPAFPLSVGIQIYTQGQIDGMTVTGSVLADRLVQPFVVAPMPNSDEGRPQRPVMLHTGASGSADGFTLLRGDVTADPMRLDSVFDPRMFITNPNPQIVTFTTPPRGQFRVGDYVLLVDYPASRSLLLSVSDSSTFNGSLYLYLRPALYSNAAWGRFYSDQADLNYVFQPGAIVVKVDAPVEYRWDGTDTLLRRFGDQAWSVAATGVTSFNVSEVTTTNSYGLSVSASLMSDTAFGNADRSQLKPVYFEETFNPLPLNLTLTR
jgi:prepilin-type N-terminal cleavage/methylation domain-containing protein